MTFAIYFYFIFFTLFFTTYIKKREKEFKQKKFLTYWGYFVTYAKKSTAIFFDIATLFE